MFVEEHVVAYVLSIREERVRLSGNLKHVNNQDLVAIKLYCEGEHRYNSELEFVCHLFVGKLDCPTAEL